MLARAGGRHARGEGDARLVSQGQRSSLYREEGVVYRRFHDTGAVAVVPTRVDARGVRRYERNRTDRSLGRAGEPPPHLVKARDVLLTSTTIDDVARSCGVRRSTAWQYITRVCELYPDAASHVLSQTTMVCPELEDAASRVDLNGDLRTVMLQIESQLNGNIVWRCEEDRFSQLRLLRICLGSMRSARS